MKILTPSQVRTIRALRGTYTQRDLAARFCVAQPTISQAQTRATWKKVTP